MGHNNDNDNDEAYYVRIEDACVQEARENYYTGCILEKISGTPSLYCTDRDETPFSFTLRGNNNDESWIEFDNGKVWAFRNLTKPKNDMLRCFAMDYIQERQTSSAYISGIFSDSIHLSIESKNVSFYKLQIRPYGI